MIEKRPKNKTMWFSRIYIIAVCLLLTINPAISQVVDDDLTAVDEPVEGADADSLSPDVSAVKKEKLETEKKVEAATPRVSERTSSPVSAGLTLLDITDAWLYDRRVPGIELEKSEQIIADIDEPSIEDMAKNSSPVEQSTKESDVKDNNSFRTLNRAVKVWLPRILIIFLVVILVILYNSKSKKKRRRVFRKIPSKRRL